MASVKKRYNTKCPEGVAHVKATFNNTQISVTDPQGNLLKSSSAGGSGFKGARKGTPYGAQLAAEAAGRFVVENFSMKKISIKVCGPGAGRESAVRGLRSAGLDIVSLEDRTRLPHNGCRPPKKRRV